MPFLLIFGSTFLVFSWAILWRNSSLLAPTRWHAPRSVPRIALTFDDGPDPRITPLVLDILQRHGVQATFFCIGEQARRHPDLIRLIHEHGHLVANHSYEHDWRMNFWHPSRVARSLVRNGRLLARLVGYHPRFYRPPVGIKSPPQALMSWKLGLEFIGWARAGRDGGPGGLRPAALARLARTARAGDVILLHDGKPASADGAPVIGRMIQTYREHLPAFLDALRARGLEPVRLDTLFSLSGVLEPADRRGRQSIFVKGWWANLGGTLRHLMREHATPLQLALALGLGVMVGSTPFFGLHALFGLVLAIKLRLNKLAVFLGTNISNPLSGPLVILANIQVGCRLLTGAWLPFSLETFRHQSFFSLGNRLLLYWVAGFPIATTALAALLVAASYPVFRIMRGRSNT